MPRKYDQDRKQFMKVPQSWRDDDDDKPKRGGLYFGGRYLLGANTPREFGRRLGCCLAVVTILCQLLRIYLKHEIERKRLANEAWLATAKQMHFENHTCHTRHSSLVEGCSPIKCARVVIDKFITKEECGIIISLAEFGMANGGGEGGATIMDLPSGALSYGNQFINLHQLLAKKNETLPQDAKEVLKAVMSRVRHEISDFFGVKRIMGTTPRFISRMDQKPPKTPHDEYWHEHVDANQYPGFEYTALLYLNEQGSDYKGGKFSFVDPYRDANGNLQIGEPKMSTVRPECGRLIFFTSGSENVHRVHKVESGKRYALTIAFTCDDTKAMTGEWDPK